MSRAPIRPRRARLAALLVAIAAIAVLAAASVAQAKPRVVALTPFTANTLANLDVRPLAVGQTIGGSERISRKLQGVPRLALSHPNGPSLELLAVLYPKLVLSAPVWRRGNLAIDNLGIRVVELDPRRVSDVPTATERIGALVSKPRTAAGLAADQRAHIAYTRAQAKRHPRVLMVLGVGRASYAFMPNSWGGDVITQAGGRLITGGLSASDGYARISDEFVIQQNPDVIIAVPHGNPKDIPRLTSYLRSNPAWSSTKAARRGRVYVSTDNSLLQAWTSPAQTMGDVQRQYLRNR
jgi:iron complex transport system substrate-binding protein